MSKRARGVVHRAALSHFAVFCPSLGPDDDTTHEQILFYQAATLPPFYPHSANDYYSRNTHLRRRSSGSGHYTKITTTAVTEGSAIEKQERVVTLDMKLREIGLAVALTTFSSTFNNSSEVDQILVVRSDKRRMVVYQPELGVFLQLSMVVPRRVVPYGKERNAYSVEFLEDSISDDSLRAWLCSEYHAYRLLFGPISWSLINSAGRQRTRRQLDFFFGRTIWQWDQRWDPKHGNELDLFHSLCPLPRLPMSYISLGGFDELWRDLSALPEVTGAMVLWKGRELVWSSWQENQDIVYTLRALVAWSQAVYAPAFINGNKQTNVAKEGRLQQIRQPSRPASIRSASPATTTTATTNNIWSLPGSNWMRNWGGGSLPNTRQPNNTGIEEDASDTNSSSNHHSNGAPAKTITSNGGLSDVFSRAVTALVEPRAPTPPEEDPAFVSSTIQGQQYQITQEDIDRHTNGMSKAKGKMFVSSGNDNSDTESLASVNSMASVRTTRTSASVLLSRPTVTGYLEPTSTSGGRNRSTTIQGSNRKPSVGMRATGNQHRRSPSIFSNTSAMTAQSNLLRDDTRLSATNNSKGGSWWPSYSIWGWGSGGGGNVNEEPPPLPETTEDNISVYDMLGGLSTNDVGSSSTDPDSTFLFTGEHPFPGLLSNDTHATSNFYAANNDSEVETVSQLGLAMDENIPPAYEHGVDVDVSRGVVLAPRGIPGMLYDTRLLRQMYLSLSSEDTNGQVSSALASLNSVVEMPLFVPARSSESDQSPGHQSAIENNMESTLNQQGSRTLVYRYGDMLFVVFGKMTASNNSASTEQSTISTKVAGRRGRRRRKEIVAVDQPQQPQQKFNEQEAQMIEETILRYAESLQAATKRDVLDIQARRKRETGMSRQRRIPPYVLQEHFVTQTNWWLLPTTNDLPLSRSFQGFVVSNDRDPPSSMVTLLPNDNVTQALRVVNTEVARQGDGKPIWVGVRMQEKGWIAGLRDSKECYCVIDQPKATLADAINFLKNIVKRASSINI